MENRSPVLMQEMTWEEVRDNLKNRKTVIVPIGSTEQQGPHLPIGTESIISWETAKHVGNELGILVAPLLPISYTDQMTDFPGTLSIPRDVMTEVVYNTCKCVIRHGAEKIVFINMHVGSLSPLEVAARRLRKETGCLFATADINTILKQITGDIFKSEDEPFGHASAAVTSLALYLCPSLVRKGKIISDRLSNLTENFIPKGGTTVSFKGVNFIVYNNVSDGSKTGCGGNATVASAETGKELFKRLGTFVKEAVLEFNHMHLR